MMRERGVGRLVLSSATTAVVFCFNVQHAKETTAAPTRACQRRRLHVALLNIVVPTYVIQSMFGDVVGIMRACMKSGLLWHFV